MMVIIIIITDIIHIHKSTQSPGISRVTIANEWH